MKRGIFFLCVSLLFVFSSCELETSSHGDLYGMWHLERIDSLSSSAQLSMRDALLFWSFQGKLLELDDKSGEHRSVLLRFEERSDALRVYEPYLYNREEGDEPLSDAGYLRVFGIQDLEETFSIEELGGSRLVLRSNLLRLHLRRF